MLEHYIVNIRGEQFLSSPILTAATQIEHAGKIEFHKFGKPYLRNLSVVNEKYPITNLSTPFLIHHTPLWKNTQQINNSTRLEHILKKLQMVIEYVALLGLYYEGSFFTKGEVCNPIVGKSLCGMRYSISQEICTRILLCCALSWLYIDWFPHIHQAYFTGTGAI